MPEQRKPDFPAGHIDRSFTQDIRPKFRQAPGMLGPAYN